MQERLDVSNPVRNSKASLPANQLAEKLAFAMELQDAAQLFLDTCIENFHAQGGAVFLADTQQKRIVACPASKGQAVSAFEREKLDLVCKSGRPKRFQNKDGVSWCFPLRHEQLTMGCLVLHNSPKPEKPILNGLLSEYSRFLARSTTKNHAPTPAAIEETRRMLHDFRNMLAGLSGYAQLLHQQATQLNPKQVQEYAGIIEKEAERLARIAENTLCELRGEKHAPCRSKRIPAEVIGDLHGLMSVDLSRHGIHLLTRIESEKELHADPDLLQRALVNLLVNAKEALPGGGIIEVAAEQTPGHIEFRVSDSGPGIPPEIADQLFKTPISYGKENGQGLGLGIVKEVADLFGGEVRLEPSPFGGASVVLSLPS